MYKRICGLQILVVADAVVQLALALGAVECLQEAWRPIDLSAVSGYCWTRDLDWQSRCGLAALAALDLGSPYPAERQQMSHFTTNRKADGVASGSIGPILKAPLA